MKRRQTRLQIWAMPSLAGILTATGLIAALAMGKTGDLISWVSLSVPVVITTYFWFIKTS